MSSEQLVGRPRPLALRLPAVDGESLASYVARLASRLGVSTGQTLIHLGLAEGLRPSQLPNQYGFALSDAARAHFQTVTQVPDAAIDRMLLTQYAGIVFELQAREPPLTLPQLAARGWFHPSASGYCPACLSETPPAWRTEWKLAWCFACERHATLLESHCPSCRRPAGGYRSDGSSAPPHPSVIPTPGTCANPAATGEGVPGRREPCGHPLGSVDADELDDFQRHLDAQRRLRCLYDGQGDPATFAALKAYAGLILYLGEPTTLERMPPSAAAALWDHLARRQDIQERRQHDMAQGRDGRRGSRHKLMTERPSPALMAAIVPLMVDLRDADVPGRRDLLAELISGTTRHRRHFHALPAWAGLSGEDAAIWRDAVEATRSHVGRAIARSGSSDTSYPIDLRLVPHAFPHKAFPELFDGCFPPGVGELRARRFVSLAIVKFSHRTNWAEAAKLLGRQPIRDGRNLANGIATALDAQATRRVADAVRRADRHLRDGGVDYQARREALADFVAFDAGLWQRICAQSGMHPGHTGTRNRLAAAYAWAQLVEDDVWAAPTFGGAADRSQRTMYFRFEKTTLTPLIAQLLEDAAALLLD